MLPEYLHTASYAASAVAFTMLAVLLLTSWKGRLQGGLLLAAVAGTALWAAAISVQSRYALVDPRLVLGVELLRDLLWILFLMRLVYSRDVRARGVQASVAVVAVVSLLASGLILHMARDVDLGWRAPDLLLMLFVGCSVYGLVLIEQIYRSASPDGRWRLKFLCLGLGAIITYDLYMYSHALLVQSLDNVTWWMRGVINALAVPFLMVAAARNPTWSLDVFVSRKVVFHSFAMTAAGVYLIVMAFAGYLIKVQGGAWGAALQTLFLFGALLLLLLVILSGQIRARIKVFVSKHFFNYKYDYRDEWLRLTRTLSDSGEELPLRAIHCLATVVESPAGLIYLHDEDDHMQVSAAWNMAEPVASFPLSESMVRFVQNKRWVINVEEYRTDRERYAGIELPPWLLDVEDAWLVLPLLHSETLVGVVILARSRAPRQLNWEDYDLLKTASYQVASDVAQARAADALANAKQFEAYNRVSAFIMHDLKNVIGQLSLVAENGKRLRGNREFVDDAFETVENSVLRMKRLLNQLRHSRDLNLSSRVDLKKVVTEIVRERALGAPAPVLWSSESDCRVMGNEDRLASVIGNVVQNAQDATNPDGSVRLSLFVELSEVILRVEDTGKGMSQSFIREQLFRPFASTKGEAGMGIGAYEAQEYLRSLGGRMRVESQEGRGTTISMHIPRVHTDAVEKVA